VQVSRGAGNPTVSTLESRLAGGPRVGLVAVELAQAAGIGWFERKTSPGSTAALTSRSRLYTDGA